MHWTAFLRNQTLPEHARIAGDLPCLKCGYNLRRAKPSGTCPECGTAVQQTLDAATCPRELGTAFRRVSPTFPPMIAIFAAAGFWSVGSWICIIGALILTISGIYRMIGLTQLRAIGALQAWPEAERWTNMLLVTACIEASTAGLLLGGFWLGLKSSIGAFDQAIETLLSFWILFAAIEITLAAMIGRSLVPVFGYAILQWESLIVLLLISSGVLIACALAGLGGGGAATVFGTFRYIVMCTIVPTAIGSAILLFHVGNAAERVRSQIEDFLEADV